MLLLFRLLVLLLVCLLMLLRVPKAKIRFDSTKIMNPTINHQPSRPMDRKKEGSKTEGTPTLSCILLRDRSQITYNIQYDTYFVQVAAVNRGCTPLSVHEHAHEHDALVIKSRRFPHLVPYHSTLEGITGTSVETPQPFYVLCSSPR